jgi:propionate CoA-transferase
MYNKVITASQAAEKIPDGAMVAMSGVGLAGTPMELVDAIADRFRSNGHPQNISLIHSGGNSYARQLAIEGLLGVYYAGFTAIDPAVTDANLFPVYSLTQGIGVQFYRAQASDIPYLTKAGLHTYLDPRQQGCAANGKAKEKPIVEVVEIGGEEYLHFMIPPVKAALIRATSADADGNLINDDETIKHEILNIAMAAHNNGGIVIAQVRNLVQVGAIDAADVKVPGMLVDYVVVCSDQEKWHPQTKAKVFQLGMTGHCNVETSTIPVDLWAPKDDKLVMARRGVIELWPGCVANVGLGTPDGVTHVAAAEGVHDLYYPTIELGAVGGVTGGGPYFGGAFNARAYMDHHVMFDFINGHGLDITFLGAAEVGEDGSVNVTRFNGRTNGSGGFVNISSGTRKVVFLTSFTAGGKVTAENGALKILTEGKPVKFVKEVQQIGFNGREAVKKNQEVMYVTERAVFRLDGGKMTLVEYAPGLDIEKDVIANMGFRPVIAPDVKPMPPFCFTDGKIGLREQWADKLGKG